MKTNMFYFSSTGNSLMIAKDIAAKLPGTQVFSIPKAMNQVMDLDADNIGIIFPVYFWGIPRIVIDFINRLDAGKAKYIFAISNYGGFAAGALLQVQEQLASKGLTLHAGFPIRMPGNYIVKYGAFPVKQQEKLLIAEKRKVEAIVGMIQNQQPHPIGKSNFLIKGIGNFVYKSMLPKFPTLDQNFSVNEKCNHCNICEKVCPVADIKMTDGRPTWQGNCEHCLACIQWCPTEAIQYGTKTVNRKRYHHPEVHAKELYRES
jgi:Fe-S-cluster-containing hydrogenase component 2/flavodoxin